MISDQAAMVLWLRIRSSSLARSTMVVMAAQAGRFATQGIYFVLIARILGVRGYGALEAALALTFIAGPFVSWGAANLLTMNVARDRSTFPVYWGNVLLATLLTGVPLVIVVAVVGAWLLPDLPLLLLLTLAIAQFFGGRVIDAAAWAFQTFERASVVALLTMLPTLFRLLAVLAFIATTRTATAEAWAVWYMVASLAAALAGIVIVRRQLGSPRFSLAVFRRNLKQGGYFSLGSAADAVYVDIDKTLLARLATLSATGVYAAAYRATSLAYLPVRSLLYATYPRFFRRGALGIQGSLTFAIQLLPYAVALSAMASVGLFLLAPLVPLILGEDYAAAVAALRWLAVLPLLQALHDIAGDTLSGAGRQGLRAAVQVGTIVVNVLLNLWLIPRYSWEGAAWATLISEGGLTVVLWAAVWVVARSPREAVQP